MRWTRRRRVGAAAAGLLVVVSGALLWVWLAARTSDPVSADDALATFRAESGGSAPGAGPKPGVYTYSASGSERGGAGPVAISRDVPSDARLVVTSDADGWYAELSYSRQHIEGIAVIRGADGLRVTRRRTKITFAGFGRDDRRDADPPSLLVPRDAHVGQMWRERYRTGDINVNTSTRILRSERVRVGERELDALVIQTDSTTDGAHPGTRRETMWWAPTRSLPIRWDVTMDIGGTFAFRSRTSIRLQSVEPRV